MKKGQKMKRKRRLLDADEVERRIGEIEAFVEREGRMPIQARHGERETRLRSYFDYLIRPGNDLLDEPQRARLEAVRQGHSSKAGVIDYDEEARFAIAYARSNGQMPHQSSPDPRVRRCAFSLLNRPDRLGRVSAPLRAELEDCRKSFGIYAYRDTGELADDYEAFVESEGRAPDQKGPTLRERRLSHAIRRRKGDMTDGQLRRVYAAREAVRPRGQVSYSEKILAAAIRSLLVEGEFLGCNVTLSGREADIVVRRADETLVCVQYDGAIHNGGDSARRDRAADELMVGMGAAVLRVREPGCGRYDPVPGALAVDLPAPLLELDDGALSEAVAGLAGASGLLVDIAAADWAGIRREAARLSRCDAADVEDAAEYLFRSLTESPGAASPEMRRLKARLRARCERRIVDAPPLGVLALIEAGLDPTIFTSRFFATRVDEARASGRAAGWSVPPSLEASRGSARRGVTRVAVDAVVAEDAARWLNATLAGDVGALAEAGGRLREAARRGEVPEAARQALSAIEGSLRPADGCDRVFP